MPAPAAEVDDLADEELPHYLPEFEPAPEHVAADESIEPPTSAPPAIPTAAPAPAPTSNVVYENTPTYAAPAPEPAAATPDFGESTDGLGVTNAALELVRGLEGKALRVIARGKRDSFAFVAAKRLTKKAGAPFKARALVRTASAGMYVCLRVEELGGGIPRTTERCAAAKGGWRRVALKGVAAGKGHKLVFSIHVMAAAGGKSFDVDGFRLG